MRIYNSVTIDIETGEIEAEDSYEYDGPVAGCKGGVETEIVQSPQAREALSAIMPALYRIGRLGGAGLPLYDVPGAPTEEMMGYFRGVAPSAENIGAISPEIKAAVGAPYLEAIGQVTEQFGGGMGSAMGGLSGAGGEVLNQQMTKMIPQYTQQLWEMVQPGEMAAATAGASMAQQEWGADVAARAAPFGMVPEIAGGAMPTTVGGMSKK